MDEANKPKPEEPKSDPQFMDVRLPSQPAPATATAEAAPAPSESVATPINVTTASSSPAPAPVAEPAPASSSTPPASDSPTDKPEAEKPKENTPLDAKHPAKPKHGHMLVISIAIVVMLAIGGVVVYMFMTKNDGSVKAPSTNEVAIAQVTTQDVDDTSTAVDGGASQDDGDFDTTPIGDAALGL